MESLACSTGARADSPCDSESLVISQSQSRMVAVCRAFVQPAVEEPVMHVPAGPRATSGLRVGRVTPCGCSSSHSAWSARCTPGMPLTHHGSSNRDTGRRRKGKHACTLAAWPCAVPLLPPPNHILSPPPPSPRKRALSCPAKPPATAADMPLLPNHGCTRPCGSAI